MNTHTGYSIRKKQILNGWAECLNSVPWNCFGTFTSYHPLSKNAARVKMERMAENLKDQYSDTFRMFWVAEPFASKDYHVHALIKLNYPAITAKQIIISAWHKVSPPAGYKKHSLVLVEEYDPTKGGHYYVSKYLQMQNVDYDIH